MCGPAPVWPGQQRSFLSSCIHLFFDMSNLFRDFALLADATPVGVQGLHVSGFKLLVLEQEDGHAIYISGRALMQCLGYSQSGGSQALQKFVNDEHKSSLKKLLSPVDLASSNANQYQQAEVWVAEAGIYHLAFGSTMPRAKAFQDFVCRDLLPAIRKGILKELNELVASQAHRIVDLAEEMAQLKLELTRVQESSLGECLDAMFQSLAFSKTNMVHLIVLQK